MRVACILIFLMATQAGVRAQPEKPPNTGTPDPKIAFLKSIVLPGWGHYHVDHRHWNRGKYHLGAEAALILTYLGFRIHAANIEDNWSTYAQSEAGVSIGNRDRAFQLAVGDFENLAAYNAFHERNRSWSLLLPDTPENRWQWQQPADRKAYNDLRKRFENMEQQLPALLTLMVVNRLVSGISAYNRARKRAGDGNTTFYLAPGTRAGGVRATLSWNF